MATVQWKVLTQAPGSQTVNGRAEHGVVITAQLVGSQATFQVFVPDSQYTADEVTALLADKATHVAAVQASGS